AVAAPSGDGHDGVEPEPVSVQRQPTVLLPGRLDLALDVRQGDAAAEVDPEDRELELVLGIQHRPQMLVYGLIDPEAHLQSILINMSLTSIPIDPRDQGLLGQTIR